MLSWQLGSTRDARVGVEGAALKERRRVLEELWSFSLLVVEAGVEGVEGALPFEGPAASDVSSVSTERRAPLIRRRNSSATVVRVAVRVASCGVERGAYIG